MSVIKKPDLIKNENFSSLARRSKNSEFVYNFLENIFEKHTRNYWLKLLDKNDIPVAPVNSIHDVVSDAHLNETEFFEKYQHPTEGNLMGMRSPIIWNKKKMSAKRLHAPKLGENTKEILKKLGYQNKIILDLYERKIVK